MDQLTTGLAVARPAWEVRSSQLVKPVGGASRGTGSFQDAAVPGAKAPKDAQLKGQIEEIERIRGLVTIRSPNRLQIDRHEEAGKFIYKFLDNESGEVIKQWPPEGYLEMLVFLHSKQGGLVDESA